ncbi:hypothetical protein [Aquibacillus albus]|uniref:hypothetical protein n=1 Tax=Aquibacillus albus TaxID=1168171 RepID=UPI00195D9EAC|nr:hypothetical protein [Aquibacillus albus]
MITFSSVILGLSILFKKRYRILNMMLAVNVIRKVIVKITMNLPYLRKKILPSILGRSA